MFILLLLGPLAVIALAFNVATLSAISYEELPLGIRAGARDVNEFLNPSIKALALVLSFMCLAFIAQVLLQSLLLRRKIQIDNQRQKRRQKAISSFSNSTIEEKGSIDFKKPVHHYFHTLIPFTLLAIIKTSVAFSPDNTIIARRVIGLIEYTGYVAVITFCLRSTEERTVQKSKNLFGQLASNPSLVSFENQNLQGLPQTSPNSSILTRANMASFGVGTTSPRPTTPDSKNAPHHYPRQPPHSQKSSQLKRSPSVRISYTAQSVISSLAPEDSASTAAFRPRPPPPPTYLRTRTTHGPNGSELAPLRQDLVEQFNDSATKLSPPTQ